MNFIYNWSEEDFSYRWDNILYTIKAGEVVREVMHSNDGQNRLLIVPGIAQHFARHLAEREMLKQDIDLARIDTRDEFMRLALTIPSAEEPREEAPEPEVEEEEATEESKEEAPAKPKRRGRPKKKKVEEKAAE